MISIDAIHTAAGVLGNVFSLCLFLSPVPTFNRIRKKRSVEEFSVIPYSAAILNCMLWVLYGLPAVHPHSTLVLTINGAGTAIELSYVLLYLIFSHGRKRLKAAVLLLVDFAFIAAVTAVVLIFFHTHERRSLVVGILCVIFCIMMYLAPLLVIKLVIRTKSVEYLPLFLSVASFFNGISWTVYALIRFDPYILIPNGLGLFFSVAQLVLHAIYYKSTKIQIAERKLKEEVGLTELALVANAMRQQQVMPSDKR